MTLGQAYTDKQFAEAAPLLAKKKTRAEGRLILQSLALEFEGHAIAERARKLLEAK